MLARPRQVTLHLQSGPVQSPSSEDSGLFLSVPHHWITWWQCYIWHLIITTSSVSLLCNSPLLCTVAWGQKKASWISERYWKIFSQKDRASLDWTELIVYWQYWIMRYFDTIETRLLSRDREWIIVWLPRHCPTLCNDTPMVGNCSSSSPLNTLCNIRCWLCCISPL